MGDIIWVYTFHNCHNLGYSLTYTVSGKGPELSVVVCFQKSGTMFGNI